MATSKTLTPTNETITIDAFQDEKPDYRHVADAEGKLADAVNALNGKIGDDLQIPQRKITSTVAATIDSLAKFNSVLADVGQYYIETNASIRTTFVSLGLLPENLVGNLEARKLASNYFFLHFQSYSNREWIATIDNGTLSAWQELALSSKTEYSGTKNDTYISAMEGRVVKYGKMVSGYFIITVNTNFSSNDLALISNLPPSYNGQIQLPCICLSGDDSWKAARVRVTTSGTITTWYGFSFKSGAAYLIPVNYVCS